MRRNIIIVIVALVGIGVISCKNPSQKNELSKMKTVQQAREYASKQIYGDSPDTVFLGYHWNMSEKEVNALTKKYAKEKKLKLDFLGVYEYTMTINEIGDVPASVRFYYVHDSLSSLMLGVENVKMQKVVECMAPIYEGKGFVRFDEVFDEFSKGPSVYFFKGNTSVQILNMPFCIGIAYKNEYNLRLAREEDEAIKQAEKEARNKAIQEKNRRMQDDF